MIPAARRSGRKRARAFTLVELLVSLVIVSLVVAPLVSALMVSLRTAERAAVGGTDRAVAADAVAEVLADLRLAESFTERTDTVVAFTVPDRTGDGQPEDIRYAWSGDPDYLLTRTFNAKPAVVVAADVRSLSFTYLTRFVAGNPPPPLVTRPTILFVVPDPASLDARDLERKAIIVNAGYAVRLIAASEPAESFDAAGVDVVAAYVSEQVNAADLGSKLQDAAFGVVNEKLDLADEFGFVSAAEDRHAETLAIWDGGHPITAGLPTPVRILDATQPCNTIRLSGSETLAPDLVVLAVKDGDTNLALLNVLETGATVWDGGTAAGRRVQLPWGTGIDPAGLTNDGRTLMLQAIQWAAGLESPPGGGGEGGGGGGDETFGYTTEFPTPVSNVRRMQVATRAELAENGTVHSVSAFIDGSAHDVRLAIYDDVGGEPDTLLVESETVMHPDLSWVTIPVDPTALTAGTYWLALSFAHNHQEYFQTSGGETRYTPGRATMDGFTYLWGVSTESYPISISIHATYTPE